MPIPQPWKSYKQIATQTAPPGQLVLMLFDGAIRFMNMALGGFAMSDPASANMTIHNNVMRAQEIVRELDAVLNMERGGECASTLRNLYRYFDRRLEESDLRKSPDGILEVKERLTVLRDAWSDMLNQSAQQCEEPIGRLTAAFA